MAIIDWSIGTGGDFATFALHRSSESGSTDTQRLTILNKIDVDAEVRYFSSDFPGGVIIKTLPGREFKGDFNSASTDVIDGSGLPTNAQVFQFSGSLVLENIAIIGSQTQLPITVDGGATLSGTRYGILAKFGQAVYGGVNATITGDECMLVSKTSYAVYDASSSASININNCIIVGNNTTYGALRERFSSGNFYVGSSVLYNKASDKGLTNGSGNLLGTNNVTQNGTADLISGSTGNLINQPIGTWFEDADNDNYIINPTGQTVLSGAGEGGVDIGGYYYAVGAEISIALKDISINTYADALSLQRFTSVAPNDISIQAQVDNIDLQRFTGISVNDITINTEIDDISINRSTQVDLNNIMIQVTCDQVSLQRFTSIAPADITVGTYVDRLSLEFGILLELNDIKIKTEVDSISISRLTGLSLSDVTINTYIDDLTVNRYTGLEFSNVALNTYIDSLNIINGFMPEFGPDEITLISKTLTYKLTSNTKQYKVARK